MSQTPLGPPFTRETATKKVRLAEDAWNSQDPKKVSLAYSEGSVWRNRSDFLVGRPAIVEFLTAKWQKERVYRLIKELWAFDQNQIAVRFQYEWQDQGENWFRAYGNENWAFDDDGLMRWRQASINDVAIDAQDRKFLWAKGPRPEDYPGLLALGL